MHYVPGHEVATHISNEVKNLAHSTTIPWTVVRETEDGGSYSCQVGDIVASKLVGLFDCSPAVLTECIITGVFETTPYTILEEYDRFNQILLGILHLVPLQKQVRTCIYRYIVIEESGNNEILFQSVDHDAIRELGESLFITFAPTGYLVSPVKDNPNKCQLIFVSQTVGVEQQMSQEFAQAYRATAGALGHLWTELQRQVAEHNSQAATAITNVKPAVPLLDVIEDVRRELYQNYYQLNDSKEWKAVSRAWFDVFMKEAQDDYIYVAVQSRLFSPDPCRKVAARVYEAIRQTARWNWLIFSSDVVKEIDEGSCIVKIAAQALHTGAPSETLYLLSCRETIDGVCDVAWKSIAHEDFPLPADRTCLDFAANGCIITPNGHGSTIQWLGRPPKVQKSSFNSIVGRATTFMNGALSYIIHPDECKPVEYLPVLDKRTGEQIKKLSQDTEEVKPLPMSGNAVNLRKRKLPAAPALKNVENIVVKNIASGEKPARPFLFLVSDHSDTGKRHKFVRRRWDSAISRSTFDLLPPELLEFILSFLAPSTLRNVIPCICTRFKEFLENNALWKRFYNTHWGSVAGRIALRYCGDDDPSSFFTSNFPHWREVFMEREYIEQAWIEPERRAHGFRVSSGHTRDIRAVALIPNGHRLVTGSLDKLVRVWDAHSGVCLSTLHGTSGVVSLGVASATQIKVGYKSGLVRMVDLASLESVWEMRLAEAMRGCTFYTNKIVTWDDDVELWDESTQQRVRVFNGHTGYITDCGVSPNGSILFSASRDKTIKLWDMNSGARISSFSGHTRGVKGIAIINDYTFASVSSDKSLRIWDTRKQEMPLQILSSQNGKIKCVKYSEIGKKICTGGTDGVHIWDSKTFEHLRWDQTDCVASVALDEERLAFGAQGGVIRFYDFDPHR